MRLRALVGRVDGTHIVRSEHVDDCDSACELGLRVADDLLNKGAGNILAVSYTHLTLPTKRIV